MVKRLTKPPRPIVEVLSPRLDDSALENTDISYNYPFPLTGYLSWPRQLPASTLALPPAVKDRVNVRARAGSFNCYAYLPRVPRDDAREEEEEDAGATMAGGKEF